MDKITNMIKSCTLCGSLPKLTDIYMQVGKTRFIIIGESPAKDGWIQSKRAFYNTCGKLQASGQVLEKLLNNISLKIDDLYFTECCKCIIEDKSMLTKCSKNCLPILYEQLSNIPCDIILTMGLHPTQALLGTKINRFADVVGKEFHLTIANKSFLIIPIYHPSPINPKGYKGNVPIFEHLKQIIEN